jgi:hypothetical protein
MLFPFFYFLLRTRKLSLINNAFDIFPLRFLGKCICPEKIMNTKSRLGFYIYLKRWRISMCLSLEVIFKTYVAPWRPYFTNINQLNRQNYVKSISKLTFLDKNLCLNIMFLFFYYLKFNLRLFILWSTTEIFKRYMEYNFEWSSSYQGDGFYNNFVKILSLLFRKFVLESIEISNFKTIFKVKSAMEIYQITLN